MWSYISVTAGFFGCQESLLRPILDTPADGEHWKHITMRMYVPIHKVEPEHNLGSQSITLTKSTHFKLFHV